MSNRGQFVFKKTSQNNPPLPPPHPQEGSGFEGFCLFFGRVECVKLVAGDMGNKRHTYLVCYILNFQTQFAWRSHQLESLLGNTFSQRFTKTPTCGTMPTCQPLSSICKKARSTFQITCGRCCPDFHLTREPAQCALGSKKWSHYARICAVFCCFLLFLSFLCKTETRKRCEKKPEKVPYFSVCSARAGFRTGFRTGFCSSSVHRVWDPFALVPHGAPKRKHYYP